MRMTRELWLAAMLAMTVPALQAAPVLYTSQSALLSAAASDGLTTQTIDFESVTIGSYDTSSGLATNGVTFVGPFDAGYLLSVGAPLFTTGTGNTLWAGDEIDITLSPGTYSFGANFGASGVAFSPSSADILLQLSTGDELSIPVSSDNLFPFIGFISSVPVNSIEITGPTFLTIDNVVTGTSAVPEPSSVWPALLLSIAGSCLARRRSQGLRRSKSGR